MSLPNAFVTLLTTPSYLPGALVLLHSLLDLHPAPRDFKIVCLVTPETVDAKTIGELRKAGFDLVIGVEPIGSGRAGQQNLHLMGRPDLNFALTKLHLFRLHPFFSTLIYLDADVLPLRPLSHLFTTTNPHVLSACPDTGWPDCFNSGVMVIRPRESDWVGLKGILKDGEGEDGIYRESSAGNGSFDGADQGLLNEWFSEEGGGGQWNRLPFTYNVTPSAAYTWAPAYKRYGHKISNVHFIGSNKPWSNLNGRPAGVSNVKGKEPSYDYPALLDRWYHVYDTHVRPSAAHDPDVSRRFAVPQTIAAWSQSGAATGAPQQPADRLNLEELKAASAHGVLSFKTGQYTSLPLEGRVDLLMPKPQPKPTSIALPPTPPPVDPTAMSSPPLEAAPPPPSVHQQTTQPAVWDAVHFAPPSHGKPEMSIRMDTIYKNAWEQPAKNQGSYYSAPTPQAEPQYPTLPDNVRKDDWYKQFTGSAPDRSSVSAVFPWEQKGKNRPTPGRVFPRGDTPPPERQQQAQRPTILVREPTPDYRPSPQYQSPPASTPRSMAEAMASYTNAWDNIPQINKYVKRMSGMGMSRDAKSFTSHGGLKSVPGTPKGGSIDFGRGKVGDRGAGFGSYTDTSADGDDEGDESDDEDSSESPVVQYPSSGQFDDPSYYPNHENYRDGSAQTESPPTVDAKVQVVPGGGNSPAVRTFTLPPHPPSASQVHVKSASTQQTQQTQRRSSKTSSGTSSDTTPRLISPPSAYVGQSAQNQPSILQPLPEYGFDFRGAAQGGNGNGNGGNGGRVWDPSTDPEARKRDSQQVLNRFMRAGGFGK
ncbi:uncharacterized protein I303_100303 [Kwoniella dejecticola CBS 10117]|uniref:Glycogenin glucosyltransferase n=1 Tax=Kwoniella dejecticola CBS 10117 TaxID=1296121 RepID=A0A1A6AEI9_9TREE|nr:uncharacterized protein I303_00303 [Kwoniella dejecticola CBS 10117]OBR88486.1 hypothetical protein I303_00303 [Kwoniella dejecticola CBS 10117]